MKKLLAIITALLFIGGLYAAWKVNYPSGTWRYKITVEVETPEGVKSGYSVWEISAKNTKNNYENNVYSKSVKGEAVVVDLGKRGLLIALMRGFNGREYVRQLVYWMFSSPESIINDDQKLFYYDALNTGTKSLPPEYYPLLIHLKDINDPKSIEVVYERNDIFSGVKKSLKTDRVEEVFGKGVKIKDIKIEITDEPVVFKIQQTLKWLSNPTSKLLGENPAISTTEFLEYIDFQQRNK